MQEVNLEFLYFSIYFTYDSVSGLMSAQELSASRFVDLCHGVVVTEISSYFTHTHFLNTLLTTLPFTQPSHSTPSWSENDLRLLGFVPV